MRLVYDPDEEPGHVQGGEALLGGPHEQRARAPALAVRVHVHVQIALAGLWAVVHDADLGRADEFAVLLRDQRLEVGVGVGVRGVVGDGLGGGEYEGERQVPDTGEALGVSRAEVADDHSHDAARYVGGEAGCLSFSRRCGTITA